MGILTSVPLDEIQARGSIRDADVARLRAAYRDDPIVTADEAEALIGLNAACRIKDPAWADFFVEALGDYVVYQCPPDGYVVLDKLEWLRARIAPEGHVTTHAELSLLLRVIETSRWSPPSLAVFALDQVRRAVESGTGPLRAKGDAAPAIILESDVELTRRILVAFSGDGTLALTRPEADALFEIDRAIAPGHSCPAWSDFFVRAVGNGMLAGLGRAVGSRRDFICASHEPLALPALRTSDRVAAETVNEVLDGAMSLQNGYVWSSCRHQTPEERALARLERQRLEIVTREPILETDEEWLITRIGIGGRPTENLMALLGFLRREANGLPRGLTEAVAKVMIAA